jgi:predicted metal-binding membrane protein
MTSASALESILKRDRLIVIVGLAAVASLAWAYTLAGVGMGMNAFQMTAMGDAAAPASPAPWSPVRALVVFLMWLIMMIAMMLPSAAPVALLFAAIVGKRKAPPGPELGAAAFVAGYLAVWGLFSAGAAAAQWALEMSRLLTPMMQSTSAVFDGALLLAAGAYQLTPLKQACLGRCRQPIAFITQYWRSGTGGAFRMGVAHGIFCLGCCWFLMALLFVGGVMNLYWIAGIATYVMAEKLLPRQRWLSAAAGWALIVLAAAILARAAWAM